MASSTGPPCRGGHKKPSGNLVPGDGLPSMQASDTGSGAKDKNPAPSTQQQQAIGTTEGSSESTHPKNVIWNPIHTDKLVDWLLNHHANCRILFSDKNASDLPPLPAERPLGHNKKDVQGIIAQVVFVDDAIYKIMYAANPVKFQISVGNQINTLKLAYWKCRGRFKQTGVGIIPGHPKFLNLHHAFFPWYDDLHSIWQGNPSFDLDPVNSEPDKNHAEDFLGIVQTKSSGTKKTTTSTAATSAKPTDAPTTLPNELDEEPEDGKAHQDDHEDLMDGEQLLPNFFEPERMDFDDEEPPRDVDMESVSAQRDQLRGHPSTPTGVYSQFSLLRKACTPFTDSCTAFCQSSPYLRPPRSTSVVSASTSSSGSSRRINGKISPSSKTTSTKASAVSAEKCDSQLRHQVSDLNQEVESMLASSSSGKTARYIAKMDYVLKGRELEYMTEELKVHRKDDEDKYHEAEMLHLKIQLAELMKNSPAQSSPA
ncbi:hypothetical protein SCLCIDRAFT_29595 [Scleroderma citrinum Foug A]|uniref:Uncharacterized protein n=1 Tax=Scleroderma citrinum Foug A TaxID=1036808 RepID=A0A0C3D6Q8_9AGAM|nr:hypothetical protein SCLCIDRAFT_29595 [Scleroderma citrinum Foug A]